MKDVLYDICLINIEKPDDIGIQFIELVSKEWELYGREHVQSNSEHFVENREFLYYFLSAYDKFKEKGYFESVKRYILKKNEQGELYNSYEPVIKGIWIPRNIYEKCFNNGGE